MEYLVWLSDLLGSLYHSTVGRKAKGVLADVILLAAHAVG